MCGQQRLAVRPEGSTINVKGETVLSGRSVRGVSRALMSQTCRGERWYLVRILVGITRTTIRPARERTTAAGVGRIGGSGLRFGQPSARKERRWILDSAKDLELYEEIAAVAEQLPDDLKESFSDLLGRVVIAGLTGRPKAVNRWRQDAGYL